MTNPTEWKVILTDCFSDWYAEQDLPTRKSIAAALMHLRLGGPQLGRPYADTIKESQYVNMKELRIQHQGKPLRAFFAFDPLRQAVVLCAGDKSNDKQFYKRMIRLADDEFTAYLRKMEK